MSEDPRRVPYSSGAHQVADGVWAYLQPDGGWGRSNAGVVTGDGVSLLIDTLFDLRLTAEMLAGLRRATHAAERVTTVVNTHANGDHCYGNALVADAEIVASSACAEEMTDVAPSMLAAFLQAAPELGEVGRFLVDIFGGFSFDGIDLVPPTRTFEGELDLRVGDTVVRLVEVGPAHTRGDVIVHLPDRGVVFTGDVVFHGGHPVVWSGPVSNWIAACDRILALDGVHTVVPGHGPVTDLEAVATLKGYFEHLTVEAHRGYDAGLTTLEAARAVRLGPYRTWTEPERLAVNINALYRDFGADVASDPVSLFTDMAALAQPHQ